MDGSWASLGPRQHGEWSAYARREQNTDEHRDGEEKH